jgi:hypothetical protein
MEDIHKLHTNVVVTAPSWAFELGENLPKKTKALIFDSKGFMRLCSAQIEAALAATTEQSWIENGRASEFATVKSDRRMAVGTSFF